MAKRLIASMTLRAGYRQSSDFEILDSAMASAATVAITRRVDTWLGPHCDTCHNLVTLFRIVHLANSVHARHLFRWRGWRLQPCQISSSADGRAAARSVIYQHTPGRWLSVARDYCRRAFGVVAGAC